MACRMSELRSMPFVVLLGEPGIGKSTTLAAEGAIEGSRVLKVRELMTGTVSEPGAPLFLDALDEYRIDGNASDKAHLLAHAIAAAHAPRWRLACRAEDWRKEADVAAIKRTAGGAPIVVAQLLPLDRNEAGAVLEALGECDPYTFLDKAHALGASGLTESPLSLKLLRSAVSTGGSWPRTRYDLFASAIKSLAYERNADYKFIARSSPNHIVAAASDACLLLLTSGARALWRSNDEPSGHASDARAYLTAHDIRLDRTLLQDMLDTALFRGEGEAFEPMHRTVAEFLAGQALARAVVGADDRAALPLARAIAFITGADGAPPTDLRGLYAWFAAHLAKLGDQAGVARLIDADAFTVLAYGDAAVFTISARQAMFEGLGRTDPYFLSSSVGLTALGGLASEDLAGEFEAVLATTNEATHRMSAVLQALTSGAPVASVRPRLRAIVLDSNRPEWQRLRAADAWMNGAADSMAARRELFDALASESVSVAREALRAQLAAALPSAALSVADIKSIASDFERSADDNKVMRLYSLQRKLVAEPRPELFDEPTTAWRPAGRRSRRGREVDDFLDQLLAASIRSTPGLTGSRLRRWVVNARKEEWAEPAKETVKAIAGWLDDQPGRDVELFAAILAEDNMDWVPQTVCNAYVATAGRPPSASIVRYVLAASATTTSKAAIKRLLAIAVATTRRTDLDPETYWDVYERILHRSGYKPLLWQLTISEINQWRRKQYRRAKHRRRRDAKHKAANIQTLAPRLADLRTGQWPCDLAWAAQNYFAPDSSGSEILVGIDRVIDLTNPVVAAAIETGWKYVATIDLVGVNATQLGAAEVAGESYCVEFAAIAGLDRLLDDGALPDPETMPIVVAIAVLKSNWIVHDSDRRRRAEQWAIERLNLDPSAGATQLIDYWSAALAAGATQLSSLWRLTEDDACGAAVAQAVDALLYTHRSMPAPMLQAAIRVATKQLEATRLQALAESALADCSVVDAQRTIWRFVAFALDPIEHGEQFLVEQRGAEAADLFDDNLHDRLIEGLGDVDETTRVLRETVAVRLFGRACSPDDGLRSGVVTQENRASRVVRRAIDSLAGNPQADAAVALARLIDDSTLASWRSDLRHAQAQQARLRRDHTFQYPSPKTIEAAIAGGAPVNAADLRAVATEVLRRLQSELRSDDTTPWKRYWNVDSHGKATTPRVENECRDHLLGRLRDRLEPYRIAAVLPEARRGEETRADLLFLSGAGRNLPLEAKRHFHPDIWIAASTQLQGYAASEGADGLGIYIVFWFGTAAGPTPGRPDGAKRPESARELEAMLITDLTPELRARTDVIVLDVSIPAAADVKPRRKRVGKTDR